MGATISPTQFVPPPTGVSAQTGTTPQQQQQQQPPQVPLPPVGQGTSAVRDGTRSPRRGKEDKPLTAAVAPFRARSRCPATDSEGHAGNNQNKVEVVPIHSDGEDQDKALFEADSQHQAEMLKAMQREEEEEDMS